MPFTERQKEIMADIREIKSHIKGVEDTAKITGAMYMIASSKMRRAKAELDKTRPYFDAVGVEIKRLFRIHEPIDNPYFYPVSGEHELPGAYGYLVITSDKGLAGFYNHGIIKKLEERMKEHEAKVYMVGGFGRKYCQLHGIALEDDFNETAENPTLRRARMIADRLLSDYLAGRISKIYVIYTDLKNSVYQQAVDFRLLPFHRGDFDAGTVEKEITSPFEYYPSMEKVIEGMVRSYLSGYIYSCLVDSFCCEQSARMNAMDEANKNAAEILSSLNLQYNHARQWKITQEITEISSGARALKRKKARSNS